MIDRMDKAFSIVAAAIAREFNVLASSVTPETVALDIDGWDSFSNGLLILAIEEAVGRSLPFDELAGASNVGEMAGVVAGQL